jgi:hypothetical protein
MMTIINANQLIQNEGFFNTENLFFGKFDMLTVDFQIY